MKVKRDVVHATNGKSAFKKYVKYENENSNCIKLIIMNIEMPIMDGFQSTENILIYKKKKDPFDLPNIVAVTRD